MPGRPPGSGVAVIAPPEAGPVEAVVFDMGRVLVGLGSLVELIGDPELTDDAFWPRWLSSPSVRAFERGDLAPEQFAAALVDEVGVAVPPAEFLRRFGAWPQGLLAGAAEMVRSVSVTTALLSNTNALHWEHQPDAAAVRELCDHNYVSFRIGLLKPDRAIFDHVAADLDVPPAAILFLDDSQPNVDGARAAGWRAERTVGVTEALAAMARHAVALS